MGGGGKYARSELWLLREIEGCESAVIFFCCEVVCVCGGGFGGEVSEVVGFFVCGDLCGPFFLVFVPVHAFVFRG